MVAQTSHGRFRRGNLNIDVRELMQRKMNSKETGLILLVNFFHRVPYIRGSAIDRDEFNRPRQTRALTVMSFIDRARPGTRNPTGNLG